MHPPPPPPPPPVWLLPEGQQEGDVWGQGPEGWDEDPALWDREADWGLLRPPRVPFALGTQQHTPVGLLGNNIPLNDISMRMTNVRGVIQLTNLFSSISSNTCISFSGWYWAADHLISSYLSLYLIFLSILLRYSGLLFPLTWFLSASES